MMSGYDTLSGGGIYWRENDKTTKKHLLKRTGDIACITVIQCHKAEELFGYCHFIV